MFTDDDLFSETTSMELIPSILMECFFGKGSVLFTDKYYTSPSIAVLFLQNHTYFYGTVRINRKHFFKEIVNVPLDRATALFYKSSNAEPIMTCKYRSIRIMRIINRK